MKDCMLKIMFKVLRHFTNAVFLYFSKVLHFKLKKVLFLVNGLRKTKKLHCLYSNWYWQDWFCPGNKIISHSGVFGLENSECQIHESPKQSIGRLKSSKIFVCTVLCLWLKLVSCKCYTVKLLILCFSSLG